MIAEVGLTEKVSGSSRATAVARRSRQDPDELTDEATGQAVKEVFPGQGDGKTHHQIIPEFHRLRPFYHPIRPIGRGMSSHVAKTTWMKIADSTAVMPHVIISCFR